MNKGKLAVRASALACSLLLAPAARAETPLPHQSPHETVGTVNCASSTCHGSVTPWEDGVVLRNEFTTWSRFDAHTKAWAVLDTERSNRIVHKLGYDKPATQVQICLDCHSHSPPAAQRGPRFVQNEGIGCEGCHGPAADWLASHARRETSHADSIAKGLYPTDQPAMQAKLCLSCHFGDDSRFVSHRLMGAGHPRLSFEIKTFTALAPAHFQVDSDYLERKGQPDAVRLWAVGQALAAQQQLETLLDPVRGRSGLMPELVLFDCHACHHPMSNLRWQPRGGPGPGSVRLNDSNLLMLRVLVRTLWPSESPRFNEQVKAAHLAVSSGVKPHGKTELDLVRQLADTVRSYLPRLERQSFPAALQVKVLTSLVDEATESSYADYAAAEQSYMAIVDLVNELIEQHALPSGPKLKSALSALLDCLAQDERYSPTDFVQRLGELRRVLGSRGES